jgi:hypothetical protein
MAAKCVECGKGGMFLKIDDVRVYAGNVRR